MDIKYQKFVADDIMEKLETVDSNCILAGGAPRDWFLGILANDLDFYIHINGDVKNTLNSLGFFVYQKGSRYNPYSNPHLDSVFECLYKDCKIQFMFMNDAITPDFVLGTFLLDICKVWYKGGTIQTHPHFDESVSHKIIREVGNIYNPDYVQKIKNRFPSYLYIGEHR